MAAPGVLDQDKVTEIRLSDKTDHHFAGKWGLSYQCVRYARIGKTYKDHPVPPQTTRRRPGPKPL